MSRSGQPVATIVRMHSRSARALIIAVAAGVAAVMGGCSSSSSNAGTTSTTSANKSFQVSTPDGEASLSLDGRLPSSWPQGFPVPSGATPAGSGSLASGGSGGQVAVYTTSASGSDTFSFYKSHPGLTTSGAKSVGVGSSFVGSTKIGGTYDGSVTVLSVSGHTYIVVVLTGSSATTTSTSGM